MPAGSLLVLGELEDALREGVDQFGGDDEFAKEDDQVVLFGGIDAGRGNGGEVVDGDDGGKVRALNVADQLHVQFFGQIRGGDGANHAHARKPFHQHGVFELHFGGFLDVDEHGRLHLIAVLAVGGGLDEIGDDGDKNHAHADDQQVFHGGLGSRFFPQHVSLTS